MKILLPFLLLMVLTAQSQTKFPLKISGNKRYFISQQGKPFLYHAETGWQIFTNLTTEEAVEYLSFRKSQGFNTIQVQVVMSPEQVNRYGRHYLMRHASSQPRLLIQNMHSLMPQPKQNAYSVSNR